MYMMSFFDIYMMRFLDIYMICFLDIYDGCPGDISRVPWIYLFGVLEIYDWVSRYI